MSPGENGGNSTVVAVCVSERKGERKTPVPMVTLMENQGIAGDGHAGEGHRQVSLLAMESIEKMLRKGLSVSAGDFAENITTEGILLTDLPVGARLRLGEAVLEVTQIKECHRRAIPSVGTRDAQRGNLRQGPSTWYRVARRYD
jgi:MOSC domain-containing protein YiiM